MTTYEYLASRRTECLEKAQRFKDDNHLVAFYEGAAESFAAKAERLTVEEAATEYRA